MWGKRLPQGTVWRNTSTDLKTRKDTMCVTTLRLQRHDVSPHSTGKDTMHHHIFTFFWGRTKKGSKALQLHHLSVGHWDIVFYLVHNILQQEPLHGLYDLRTNCYVASHSHLVKGDNSPLTNLQLSNHARIWHDYVALLTNESPSIL